MKKLLLVFLSLPLMVFGQPKEGLGAHYISVEFRMAINTTFMIEDELDMWRTADQHIGLLVRLRIPLEHTAPYTWPRIQANGNPPAYLTTFTLSSPTSKSGDTEAPQERLNRLLAMNDPEFPKENTLFKGLNAVRYSNSNLDRIANRQEWFGPKISL